ncbi:MAG: alanine racemase [Myxococcota bacterium]|jgi:alanine racemase
MEASVVNELTNVVYDVAAALRLNEVAVRQQRIVPIHIKVDTGMGRLGVMPAEWSVFLDAIGACSSLHVEGVLTHFAHADESPERTAEQVASFESAIAAVHARGWKPTFVHADNSAATLGFHHRYNMARPGISLYGPRPGPSFEPLEPAMALRTEVLFAKHIPSGTKVSYAGTWTSARPTQLAVLPIGYADGYPRVLGGRAHVLIHGQRAPIRGRVCMDLTMVDVTDIQGTIEEGTPVVLFGSQGNARIDVAELAGLAGTISYEILTGLTERVPRTWITT